MASSNKCYCGFSKTTTYRSQLTRLRLYSFCWLNGTKMNSPRAFVVICLVAASGAFIAHFSTNVTPKARASEGPNGNPAAQDAAGPKAGGRTLLTAAQLVRVGGWRVDPYVRNGKSMAYSEGGIDVRNGHFWLSHHAHLDAVARFEIPQSMGIGNDINAWPVLKATDYVASKWRVQGGAVTMGVHQLDAQTLLVSARSDYATPPTSEPWLQRFDLRSRQWLAPLKPEGAQIQHHAGGFCRIPKWFAEEHFGGRTLGLCAGGYESGQGSSMGPALTAVDRETLTDGLPLLSYPWVGEKAQREQRPADYDPKGLGWALEPEGKIGYWSVETQQGGGAWVDTGKYHGLVYFIRQGRGRLDYKLQTECFSKDRLSRLYIYDPADLAKVATGELEPFEPRAIVTDWHEPGVARGATWDGKHLFVFQEATWKRNIERYPSIHVFEIVDAAE